MSDKKAASRFLGVQATRVKHGLFHGGVFTLVVFFLVFFSPFFPLLASWLLGFLTFRLLGFLASLLFGFSAFGGLLALAFRILCIPSSSSAGGMLAFAAFRWFMRLLAVLAFRILCFPSSSPGLQSNCPLFESTLLQTSGGGCRPSPTPPLLFRFLAEIELHP